MNETMNILLNRRSMRAYKPDMPTAEQLDQIMQAALWSPSAVNKQECHVTQITDAKLINDINMRARATFDDATNARFTERNGGDPDFSVYYFAPVVYVISSPDAEFYSIFDSGVTAQNICIAAESIGLNSCIIGIVRLMLQDEANKDLLAAMNLPKGNIPLMTVAVGYGNKEMPAPPRVDGRCNKV